MSYIAFSRAARLGARFTLAMLLPACAHSEAPRASNVARIEAPAWTRSEVEAFLAEASAAGPVIEPRAREAYARTIALAPDPQAPLVALAEGSEDPALVFAVANMLFDAEPDTSLRLHERASALSPGNPSVAFELALHMHARGRCTEAIDLYEIARGVNEGSAPLDAMLAHCLLQTGRIDEAIARFRGSSPRENHVAIESLAASIFAGRHAWRTRARLAGEARGGDPSSAVRLVLLDLSFASDLWNARRNDDALAVDLPIARAALTGSPDVLAMLELLVSGPEADPEAVSAAMSARFPGRLPAPVELASLLLETRLGAEGYDAARALAEYERDLRARFPADPVAARLLPTLLAMNERTEEVHAIDATLCERGSVRSCATRIATPSAEERAARYAAFRERFPNDPRGPAIALLMRIAAREPLAEEELIAFLVTRPHHMPSSAAWRLAFQALEAVRRGETPRVAVLETLAEAMSSEMFTSNPECDPWSSPEDRAAIVCQTRRAPR